MLVVLCRPAHLRAHLLTLLGPAQANFRGEALLRQHLEGPAHRKAEARAEALRLRNERLGHNRGAAEAAVVR